MPFAFALRLGWKQGFIGMIVGLTVGLVFSSINVYGVWRVTGPTFARIDKLKSEWAQEGWLAAFYLAILLWAIVSCVAAELVIRELLNWIG